MDKILFLSEFSKLATDIHEQLEKSFSTKFLGFEVNAVRSFIKEENPVVVVAYIKELPYESEHALHLCLPPKRFHLFWWAQKMSATTFLMKKI